MLLLCQRRRVGAGSDSRTVSVGMGWRESVVRQGCHVVGASRKRQFGWNVSEAAGNADVDDVQAGAEKVSGDEIYPRRL